MQSRSRRRILRSLALATAMLAWLPTASAQEVDAPPPIDLPTTGEALDPASPMADLPGLGVDWPDINAPDAVVEGEDVAVPG